MTGSAHVASEQGLLSVGIEMNRSDLRSDGVMNQLVKRGNNHTVKILVEHASDPTGMAASEEFLEVWQEFESELIAAQATSGSAALQPLRMLLGQLPVGHTRYRKSSEPKFASAICPNPSLDWFEQVFFRNSENLTDFRILSSSLQRVRQFPKNLFL